MGRGPGVPQWGRVGEIFPQDYSGRTLKSDEVCGIGGCSIERRGRKMADTEKRIVSHAHADIVPGTVYLTPEGTIFLDLG